MIVLFGASIVLILRLVLLDLIGKKSGSGWSLILGGPEYLNDRAHIGSDRLRVILRGPEFLKRRECPAVVNYTWNGPAGGAWTDPNYWAGGTPGQYPGQVSTEQDVAIFNNTDTANCTLNNGTKPVVLSGLQVTGGYTGTITLNSPLGWTGQGGVNSQLAGGTINQPNGANSEIGVGGGVLTLGACNLNGNPGVASTLIVAPGAEVDVTAGAPIGDNIVNSGTVKLTTTMTQAENFTNNAGITNNGGASLLFDGAQGISTNGTGVIANGGLVQRTATTTKSTTVPCALPLINNASSAVLQLYGNLQFSQAGTMTGVSVLQTNGEVDIENGATLFVPFGYTQNSGWLFTNGKSNYIDCGPNNGNVAIHGGNVIVNPNGGYGTLTVNNGSVTMDGGTLVLAVDGTTLSSDEFLAANGFVLKGSSSLFVETLDIPPGGVAPGQDVYILNTAFGAITGNFTTVTYDPMGIWTLKNEPATGSLYLLS
jgi:hypothetical protein